MRVQGNGFDFHVGTVDHEEIRISWSGRTSSNWDDMRITKSEALKLARELIKLVQVID